MYPTTPVEHCEAHEGLIRPDFGFERFDRARPRSGR